MNWSKGLPNIGLEGPILTSVKHTLIASKCTFAKSPLPIAILAALSASLVDAFFGLSSFALAFIGLSFLGPLKGALFFFFPASAALTATFDFLMALGMVPLKTLKKCYQARKL